MHGYEKITVRQRELYELARGIANRVVVALPDQDNVPEAFELAQVEAQAELSAFLKIQSDEGANHGSIRQN